MQFKKFDVDAYRAVMVALIIAACIATVNIMGTDVNNTFDKVNQALPT